MDLIKVTVLSVVSLAVLLLLTKLMGNKQVSQLSIFDYIIGISIGSIAAELATDLENPMRSFLAMIIYGLIAYLVSLATGKSVKTRKVVIGRPLILYDNGKLYRSNFSKARIDISDFLMQCRNKGYFDLSDIQTAVFEYNGAVSILPSEGTRPLTPTDVKLDPDQKHVLVNVILDGHINPDNLKMTGNNDVWLEKQLHDQGFHSAEDVFLGTVDTTDNTLSLYPMNAGENKADPFE